MSDGQSQSTLPSPVGIIPQIPGPPPGTFGTQSVQVAPVNLTRLGLYVFNPQNNVTIWIAPLGVNASSGGVASIAIQPLQGMMLGPPNMPPWTNGLNVVAASGTGNIIGIFEFSR